MVTVASEGAATSSMEPSSSVPLAASSSSTRRGSGSLPSDLKGIRFNDLGAPIQKFIRTLHTETVLTEEDLQLFHFVSVREMAKVFEKMELGAAARELWDDIRPNLAKRKKEADNHAGGGGAAPDLQPVPSSSSEQSNAPINNPRASTDLKFKGEVNAQASSSNGTTEQQEQQLIPTTRSLPDPVAEPMDAGTGTGGGPSSQQNGSVLPRASSYRSTQSPNAARLRPSETNKKAVRSSIPVLVDSVKCTQLRSQAHQLQLTLDQARGEPSTKEVDVKGAGFRIQAEQGGLQALKQQHAFAQLVNLRKGLSSEEGRIIKQTLKMAKPGTSVELIFPES